MVYTLVSAATLGFDLARLPDGAQVADVLLTGLLADGPGLARLARQHRTHCVLDPELAPRADAGQTRRARELAAAGGAALQGLTTRARSSSALVAELETSTLGDAAALERLVHGDLVETTDDVDERTASLAREVLADAALAAYAASALPPELRRLLRAGYADAAAQPAADGAAADRAAAPSVGGGGLAAVLGPQGAEVLEVLAQVSATTSAGRASWLDAADAARDDLGTWARSMHEACWAAHVAGRTRATAAAQLLAVAALHEGGFAAADAAGGVWNALAGVVQGIALSDVLPDDVLEQLLAPWRRVCALA